MFIRVSIKVGNELKTKNMNEKYAEHKILGKWNLNLRKREKIFKV